MEIIELFRGIARYCLSNNSMLKHPGGGWTKYEDAGMLAREADIAITAAERRAAIYAAKIDELTAQKANLATRLDAAVTEIINTRDVLRALRQSIARNDNVTIDKIREALAAELEQRGVRADQSEYIIGYQNHEGEKLYATALNTDGFYAYSHFHRNAMRVTYAQAEAYCLVALKRFMVPA